MDSPSDAAAAGGARVAAIRGDDAHLAQWAERALPTLEGARVFHFLGERQRIRGDLAAAKLSLWRALFLMRERDPMRAMNTALALQELARSTEPPEVGIWFARLAWEQARRGDPDATSFAAEQLVEQLIDVGEITTAQRIVDEMPGDASNNAKFISTARIEEARGHYMTAGDEFAKASDPKRGDTLPPILGKIEAAQAYVDAASFDKARDAVKIATETASHAGTMSVDRASRLAAVQAAVQMFDKDANGALLTLDRALAANPRDAARVQLLDMRGEVLALLGKPSNAEQAWRDAAESIKHWRESIPTTNLRSGLVNRHRHALEAWLDSTGSRSDPMASADVAQRILGRALLDRLHQREANATTIDASIDDVVQRLAIGHEIAATLPKDRDLRQATRDFVAIMAGARWVWAIRRIHGSWSLDRVGARKSVLAMVDDYRARPDDAAAASAIGAALFPFHTLPTDGSPIAVLLDRAFADLLLPGVRVGDKYLVEYGPILEILAPELLFEDVSAPAPGPPIVIGDSHSDLPAAASEAADVARALGTAAFLQARATREALSRGRGASVLHIATHSTTEHGRAALVLADVDLPADTIAVSKIAPRIAVVASCRSQKNDDPSSSLVAAFLAAGASAAIGSKRSLDDAAAADLMRAFYAADGANDPMRALATAQREAIAAKRPPSRWAVMSCFGVGGWLDLARSK